MDDCDHAVPLLEEPEGDPSLGRRRLAQDDTQRQSSRTTVVSRDRNGVHSTSTACGPSFRFAAWKAASTLHDESPLNQSRDERAFTRGIQKQRIMRVIQESLGVILCGGIGG